MAIDEQVWEAELLRLEEAVNKSEGDGLRARWESGRHLLTHREGKQLPRGEPARLPAALGVRRPELTARMKFATKFPGEQELTDVIRKFKTWFAITHQALPNKPSQPDADDAREDETEANDDDEQSDADDTRRDQTKMLRHVIRQLDKLEPADFDEAERKLLDEVDGRVQR